MKKIVCIILCILLVFSLSACGGDVSEVKTHNVESESYSEEDIKAAIDTCLLYTSPSPRDYLGSRMPSSA